MDRPGVRLRCAPLNVFSAGSAGDGPDGSTFKEIEQLADGPTY